MKLSTLIAAAIVICAAPLAFATANIQKDAKVKHPEFTCKTCHSATPFAKTNLTEEGKKWIPAAKK